MASSLYLCANHLGNEFDFPIRTIDVLKKVDVIFAEDTRTASRFLRQYQVETPVKAYYDHNEQKRCDELELEFKQRDISVAVISEAGMPLISDPGYRIVNLFHKYGYPVTAVPGPSACITALALAGYPLQEFYYCGFWPRKMGQGKKMAERISELGCPVVFYESGKRILKTLNRLSADLPSLQVFVVKELTKPYEKYWRGDVANVKQDLERVSLKGEFTVVVYKSAST